MRDLYTTNTSETTTLTKTAYRFTSHSHNNGNVQCTIMVVTGQQHTISNENGQFIYIIRVQVEAIRYEIYTINEQYTSRVNIIIKSSRR